MTLDTDLSRAPYFDDYNSNSNHYAVLFRPGVPVQAREMNAAQSILQDQIDKFGRSIYKEGSVLEGCAFTFDNQYAYVKIADNYANGTAFTIEDFIGRRVQSSSNLTAIIVDAVPGYTSQAPDLNTLYIKYINSGTYSNGVIQSTFNVGETTVISTSSNVAIGNVAVATNAAANVGNVTGYGYAMSVTDGVIFKKGYFVRVANQSVVVSKYSNLPNNYSVGFGVEETIETPASNTALYDNAAGTPNYGAPGAHRLKLIPDLIVKTTSDISNTDTFFSLCDVNSGRPVPIKNDPQYTALGTELARRTFETNGDFVVNPFLLTTENKKANTDSSNTTANSHYLNLISSPGLAYAKGHRVEFLNRNAVDLRKGSDTANFTDQYVSANFGYYVRGIEFVGDFNIDNLVQIELHSVAKTAITSGTFLSTSYSATTKIGTAYIRGIEFASGTPGAYDAQYIVYLFNIQMTPGFNFSSVKSIMSAGSITAVADVVLTYDSRTSSYTAQLEEIVNNTMIYSFGQKAIKSDLIKVTSFPYRNRSDTITFTSTATATFSVPGSERFFQLSDGILSQIQASAFTVIPTSTGYSPVSAFNAGTVSVNTTSNIIVGTGTTFTTFYRAGDVIAIGGLTPNDLKSITAVTNATYMTVQGNCTVANTTANNRLAFPSGLPIPFNRSNRSIEIKTSGTTANLDIGSATTMTVKVHYDSEKYSNTSVVPIAKSITRNTFVKIQTNTNISTTTGPWCLGITDVLKINGVWISPNTTYSNTTTNLAGLFTLDNGQRDSHYDLAYVKSNIISLPVNSTILISVDHFQHNQSYGVGFFTANSYPIDDTNPNNTAAINTAEIPLFFSPSKGSTFDLRDCVDLRPFAANTATFTSVIASAAVNPSTTLTFSGTADSSIPGVLGTYIVSPNKTLKADVTHYLPRRDRVSVTTGGQLLITEGLSDPLPRAPSEIPGTMSLGIINVPAYPSLSAVGAKTYGRYDYATTIDLSQIKRYTMADIGTLSNRINNLEYYTSLSLLEQSATNLLVRSGTSGQNRFKNGILVDPFRGHDIGNTLHPQYSIAIDSNRQEARPFFRQLNLDLMIDTTLSTGYKQRGHLITLDHTDDTLLQQQPYASKYHNCVEGNIYNFRGNISLFPSGDTQPDTSVSPAVVNDLDLASNWINLSAQQGWGTSWGNWVTTSSSTAYGSAYQTGGISSSVTNADGSTTVAYQTQINTTTTTNQTQTGTQLGLTESTSVLNLGTFVTDISIKPYIRPKIVYFSAKGLKPNTRVYPYFNDTPVSSFCMPLFYYSGVVTTVNNLNKAADGTLLYTLKTIDDTGSTVNIYYTLNNNTFASSLIVQSDGTARGLFSIPPETFKTGDIQFRLTNISDLAAGQSAITTEAVASYTGSGLSVSYGTSILNTRNTAVAVSEVTQNESIQTNGVVSGPPVIVTHPPPPPAPIEEYSWPPPMEWTPGDNGGDGL